MLATLHRVFALACALGATMSPLSVQAGPFDGWALNGTAQVVDGGSTLQLTAAAPYESGSAWAPSPLSLSQDFSIAFSFLLTGGSGADGITLTFQNSNAGLAALGADGGFLGYGGIPNSVAFVFDTFDNGWDVDRTPGANTSVAHGGNVIDPWGGTTVGQAHALRDRVVYSWVDYTAANGGEFAMYLSDTAVKPVAPDHLFAVSSIPNVFDGPQVYMGFTGATGGATDVQQILSVSVVTAVPEPSVTLMAALGALAVFGLRRPRKARLSLRRSQACCSSVGSGASLCGTSIPPSSRRSMRLTGASRARCLPRKSGAPTAFWIQA